MNRLDQGHDPALTPTRPFLSRDRYPLDLSLPSHNICPHFQLIPIATHLLDEEGWTVRAHDCPATQQAREHESQAETNLKPFSECGTSKLHGAVDSQANRSRNSPGGIKHLRHPRISTNYTPPSQFNDKESRRPLPNNPTLQRRKPSPRFPATTPSKERVTMSHSKHLLSVLMGQYGTNRPRLLFY